MKKVKVVDDVKNHGDIVYKSMFDNPLIWGFYYFGNHFRGNSAGFHGKILKEALLNPYLAIAAPRESAKSTIVSFLYCSHSVAFRKKRFIIILQSTYAKACGSLLTIKSEFKNNPKLKDDFKVEIIKDAEGDTIFKHKDGFEVRVLCKGRDQIGSIRGEKFGAYRPDLIILDDVEDDEMVKNPELRRDLEERFNDVIMLAGEAGKTQIFAIGTILHDDCQIAKLIQKDRYIEFRKLKFKALNTDANGREYSLWEQKWSVEDLHRIAKQKPTTFARELQNDPVTGLLSRFKREDFRYWRSEGLEYIVFGADNEIKSRGSLSSCKAAISCDLAWSEKREADYSVIMGGFLTHDMDILIECYLMEKGLRPDAFSEYIFMLHDRLKALTGSYVPLGMEKAMLENVSKWNLEMEMRKRNKWISIKELKWESDKITRNENVLVPRFSQHSIAFRSGMGDLEHQLLRFPSGTHDDLVDALSGLCKLLQFPKETRKEETEDDVFMRLRARTLKVKPVSQENYVFGVKGNFFNIPHRKSF